MLRIDPRAPVPPEYMNEDGSTKKEYIEMVFPLGYVFEPTDEELLLYLKQKVKNEVLPLHIIHQDNVYGYSPETLTGKHELIGENEWYFFTSRNRSYKNRNKPDRAVATGGYWKALGSKKEIRINGVIGTKMSLEFYERSSRNAGKTRWKMDEYVLDNENNPSYSKSGKDDMKLNDWVLCKIYISKRRK